MNDHVRVWKGLPSGRKARALLSVIRTLRFPKRYHLLFLPLLTDRGGVSGAMRGIGPGLRAGLRR